METDTRRNREEKQAIYTKRNKRINKSRRDIHTVRFSRKYHNVFFRAEKKICYSPIDNALRQDCHRPKTEILHFYNKTKSSMLWTKCWAPTLCTGKQIDGHSLSFTILWTLLPLLHI